MRHTFYICHVSWQVVFKNMWEQHRGMWLQTRLSKMKLTHRQKLSDRGFSCAAHSEWWMSLKNNAALSHLFLSFQLSSYICRPQFFVGLDQTDNVSKLPQCNATQFRPSSIQYGAMLNHVIHFKSLSTLWRLNWISLLWSKYCYVTFKHFWKAYIL